MLKSFRCKLKASLLSGMLFFIYKVHSYYELYACKDDLNLRHFEIALMSDHLAKKASPNHSNVIKLRH